jgi:hypothetical protein
MASVDMSMQLNASAQSVWSLIGGFDALPRWHPAVATSNEVKEAGRTLRHLGLQGGGTIVEALEQRDDGARRYSYRIVSGPLPVRNYRSELAVEEQGPDRCRVRWTSQFEPDGAPEPDAVEAIKGVYRAGLDSLKDRFGG